MLVGVWLKVFPTRQKANIPCGVQIQQMTVTATAMDKLKKNVIRKKADDQSLAHTQITLTYLKFHFTYTCMHVFLRKELLERIQYSKIAINY